MQINFTQKFTVNTSSPKSTEMNGAIFILFFFNKKKVLGECPCLFHFKDSQETCIKAWILKKIVFKWM